MKGVGLLALALTDAIATLFPEIDAELVAVYAPGALHHQRADVPVHLATICAGVLEKILTFLVTRHPFAGGRFLREGLGYALCAHHVCGRGTAGSGSGHHGAQGNRQQSFHHNYLHSTFFEVQLVARESCTAISGLAGAIVSKVLFTRQLEEYMRLQ